MWFGLPHFSITSFPYVVAHILLTLQVSTSYVVPMVMSAREPMMQFTTFLLLLREMMASMWAKNNYMYSPQPHSSHCRVDIVFIKDGIHILVHTCRFISLILHNSRICYLRCISSQIKKLLQLTPYCYINSFFQQLKYLDVYHKKIYVFLYNYVNVIWCHNLSFGLATKAKAWKGACQECNP